MSTKAGLVPDGIEPVVKGKPELTKTDGSASGDMNEPASIQPSGNNSNFRTVECKYMYNLATNSLSGVATCDFEAHRPSTVFVERHRDAGPLRSS